MSRVLKFFNSMKRYVPMFDEQNGEITKDQIKEILELHQPISAELLSKYGRYSGDEEDVPIYSREFDTEAAKINNKLANDYCSEIVDTKMGYLIGIPIGYGVSDGETPDFIHNFNVESDIEDLDSETIKFMSICGFSARLLYLNADAEQDEVAERTKRINPWETIFFYEDTMSAPSYALRVYEIDEDEREVVFYNSNSVITYRDEDGEFQEIDRREQFFGYCPLFGIPNNAELLGDFDRVASLIDAYDRSMSDMNSEIEQFRLAYMYAKDLDIPSEDEHGRPVNLVDRLLRTGLLELGPDGEIGFITKDINDAAVENHLNRLEQRIYKGSKTPNFSDKEFAGNLSGVALKYKLFDIETKSRIAELKLKKSLRYQYKLLANSQGLRGKAFDWKTITFKFTRNIAVDIKVEAEILEKLMDLVSDETALNLMSFIENAKAEIEKKKEEDEEKLQYMQTIDLDEDDEEDEEKKGPQQQQQKEEDTEQKEGE